MGLTIHYTLTPPAGLAPSAVRPLVDAAWTGVARLVRRRRRGEVSAVEDADPEAPWAQGKFFRRVDGWTSRGYVVPPQRGACFALDPGSDCEPAIFGLCEYPATLRVDEGRRVRTGLGGWRFQGSCKTQYASLHGWAHFLACHRLVVDSLLVWQELGCTVQLTDEGGYWPGRRVGPLRAQLATMNRLVAGLGGVLKDAVGETGLAVEAPIFAHPEFEYLEAEAHTHHPDAIQQARTMLGQPPPSP